MVRLSFLKREGGGDHYLLLDSRIALPKRHPPVVNVTFGHNQGAKSRAFHPTAGDDMMDRHRVRLLFASPCVSPTRPNFCAREHCPSLWNLADPESSKPVESHGRSRTSSSRHPCRGLP